MNTKKKPTDMLYYFVFGNHDLKPLILLFSCDDNRLAITGVFCFLSALFIANTLFLLIDRYITRVFVNSGIIFILLLF